MSGVTCVQVLNVEPLRAPRKSGEMMAQHNESGRSTECQPTLQPRLQHQEHKTIWWWCTCRPELFWNGHGRYGCSCLQGLSPWCRTPIRRQQFPIPRGEMGRDTGGSGPSDEGLTTAQCDDKC